MPQQGVTFNGAFLALPGAYYGDNVSAAGPTNPPVTPPMLVIGYGWGPKPKTAVKFTNPQDFQNALRGSPLAAFVPFIANPSPAMTGAQQITFIDASSNTQSSLVLPTSGATTYATLTSTLYGPPSNQMQAQVSAATVAPSGIKLTLIDNYAGTRLVGDNLGVPLMLAYTGSASGVTYSVAASSGAMSGVFTLSSPNAGESVSIPLGAGAYATASALINAINGTGFFLAQGLSSTGGQLPTWLLTSASGAVPASSGAPTYVPVMACLQDLSFWVNQFASTMATAVPGSVADGVASLPAISTPTYFSGARGTPPVNADYAAALNVGLTVPAWTVFCDSNATAVQALMAQHCEIASAPPYGSWRRGFTGSSIGDTVATTQTNALALDSMQMCYVYPGIYVTSTATGLNTLYGGLYAAAAAAAMATGNQIAQPLTNKVLNGTGLELPGGVALTTSQLSALQNAGVMALWAPPQTNLPTILSDITTWQVDDNMENTSSQQVACRYWMAYSVVNTMMRYVGTIATPQSNLNIVKALRKTLNALIFTGGASNGVLASWDPTTLVLNYDGTQQLDNITYNAVLVGQNRYITAYASVQPLQFSITSTS